MIDEERLKEICNKNYNDVYRYCYAHLHDCDTAKDITQEVFKLFIEKSPKLSDKNIKAWLYNVAYKKIIALHRKNCKLLDIMSPYSIDSVDKNDDCVYFEIDDEIIFNNWSDEKIENEKESILAQLSDEEKSLYNDIVVYKKQYKEIAIEKKTTENAISLRSYRLKKKLKKMAKASTSMTFILILLKINGYF